jgi:hypothetical protein
MKSPSLPSPLNAFKPSITKTSPSRTLNTNPSPIPTRGKLPDTIEVPTRMLDGEVRLDPVVRGVVGECDGCQVSVAHQDLAEVVDAVI